MVLYDTAFEFSGLVFGQLFEYCGDDGRTAETAESIQVPIAVLPLKHIGPEQRYRPQA